MNQCRHTIEVGVRKRQLFVCVAPFLSRLRFYSLLVVLSGIMADVSQKDNCVYLDLNQFNDATAGDEEFQRLLFDTYKTQSKKTIEQLKTAFQHVDNSRLILCSHDLKGSSLTFGAKAVGLLCERIEMSVRAGNIDEAKQLLPELEELFSDTMAFIDAMLS